jgi:DNA-binding NarL/FixJ family response regulator
MIKVLLVDDQTLVRQGIRSLLDLSDTVRVIAELSDGSCVLPALEQQQFDVVLLDIQMPNMDGLQVLEAMRQHDIETPVIVLTTFNDDARLLRCAQLGARGYMLKDVDFEQLVSAIERVSAGELLIQTAVTQRLLHGLRKQDLTFEAADKPEPLTPRELEVMRYMAGGYSNKEIGSAVHLSEGTIKNHVSSILSKFGVRDRTRAVMKALELGFLD